MTSLDRMHEQLRDWYGRLRELSARALQADRDPEVYHGCRVLVRRLRTGLELLTTLRSGLKRGKIRELDADLRAIARAISPIRDGDVLNEHLADVLSGKSEKAVDPLWHEAIAFLKADVTDQRDLALEALHKVPQLDEPFLPTLRQLLESAAVLKDPSRGLGKILERAVADFVGQAEKALAQEDPDDWHALRLRGKRLRYLVELSSPGEEARPIRDRLALIQQILGRAHDHRVWETRCLDLRGSLSHRGRDVVLREGLAQLAVYQSRLAIRQEGRFRDNWCDGLRDLLGKIPKVHRNEQALFHVASPPSPSTPRASGFLELEDPSTLRSKGDGEPTSSESETGEVKR